VTQHPDADVRRVADCLDEYGQVEVPESLQTKDKELFFKASIADPSGTTLKRR